MKLNVYFTPIGIFLHLWRYKSLIIQFTKREVIAKYKGSVFGLLWTVLTPIMMLTVYTLVFSEIFKSKWPTGGESKLEFAFIVFCGLIMFNIFAEVVTRAPSLIIGNTNYVKKVVFPLEILPVVIFCASIIQAIISCCILVLGLFFLLGVFHWTFILIPIVVIPLTLFTLGIAWFVSSLGVFLRDIGQILGVVVQGLMLLSPIFYPISLIPKDLLFIYLFNPLTYVVEDVRRIIVWGQLPQWDWLIYGTILGSVVFVLGYYWFQRTKGGFADVL